MPVLYFVEHSAYWDFFQERRAVHMSARKRQQLPEAMGADCPAQTLELIQALHEKEGVSCIARHENESKRPRCSATMHLPLRSSLHDLA